MALEIRSDKISFDGQEFTKGDVTASKEFETKRKSDDGIPLKRLRAFNSASTFIDFNTTRRKQRPGQAVDVFVKDSYEALHIDPYLVSIGPKNNIPLELTGSIKTFSKAIHLSAVDTSTRFPITIEGTTQFKNGEVEISGSTYISGATEIPQPWLDALDFATGSNPIGTYGLIMDGGVLTTGIITADNALSVMPGTSLIYGALGTIGGTGNTAETSQDIVIQPNTTTTINVSEENPSYTIAVGTNYTISAGADVTIISPNQTFTGGTIDDGIDSGGTGTFEGGVGNSSIIATNQTIPVGANIILYVSPYNDSITIQSNVNLTIANNADLTIKLP